MELGELAATAHQVGVAKLQAISGRGWIEPHEGFVVSVSELPAPPFNGAIVYHDFAAEELAEALRRVADSGFPFSLQSRPGPTDSADAVARRFGLKRQPGMPLMALTGPPAELAPSGLTVRRLTPDEGVVHATIAADAFGGPLELALQLATPEMMTADGVHFLGGELDGETVTTAVADVTGENAWIYSVGTLGPYRRRGLGAAVTAAAVNLARDAGARFIFLTSSSMGMRVYESLGFRQLEWWSSWLPAS